MRTVIVGLLLAVTSVATALECPNIVFIFIDDMGYGDIGPFGSTNRTPHLDRMAEEGMKLTDFYVSATMCTPSRAALMTGCYADRVGMEENENGPVVFPADTRGLNPSEITIAEVLKAQGYATGCFGKWHLGDQLQFMPLAQGFDEYEGTPYSNNMWPFQENRTFPPLPYMKQEKVVAEIADGESQAILCEAVTDAAIDFIKRHRRGPFFAYVPHSFTHLPRYASEGQVKRAEGDMVRAQIEAVDMSVGRILATLREQGLAENTLVFFTSDNGPAAGSSAGPLKGRKGGPKFEGHMRVPTQAWWPGRIPASTVCSEIAASIDIFPTLAKLAGGEVPTDRIIDGKNILALLTTPGAKSPHSELYYEYDGVRKGKWKYLKAKEKFSLYDLDADLGEKTNLLKLHPEKVEELRALLLAHEQRVKNAVRPAGYDANPEPLLKDPGSVPTLAEYLGKTGIRVVKGPRDIGKKTQGK